MVISIILAIIHIMNIKKIIATLLLLFGVFLSGNFIIVNSSNFPNEEYLAGALFLILIIASILGFYISRKL